MHGGACTSFPAHASAAQEDAPGCSTHLVLHNVGCAIGALADFALHHVLVLHSSMRKVMMTGHGPETCSPWHACTVAWAAGIGVRATTPSKISCSTAEKLLLAFQGLQAHCTRLVHASLS